MTEHIEPDEFDASITYALDRGWLLAPQVHGGIENSIWLPHDGVTDVVTLPEFGDAVVLRMTGGPVPGYWRRPGHPVWRHQVPVRLAIEWLKGERDTDEALGDWEQHARKVRKQR